MGNYLGCMGSGKKKKATKKVSVNGGMRRTRGSLEDELMMEQQALAHMALHPHHHEHKGAQLLRFESSSNSLSSSLHRDHLPAAVTTTAPPRRSYSGKPSSSSKLEYTRSSSTRPRHSSDLLLDPQQLLNCTRVWFFPLPSSSSSLSLSLALSLSLGILFAFLDCHKARLLFFFSHHLSLSTHPPPHAHLLSITLKHAK